MKKALLPLILWALLVSSKFLLSSCESTFNNSDRAIAKRNLEQLIKSLDNKDRRV